MHRAGCNTVLNRYDDYSHYIPSVYEASAVKVVNLNFIILQDDNGNYNFSENNPADIRALDSIASYLNRSYRQLAPSSDPCPGVAFIPNAMIQFHVNKIFVKSSYALNYYEQGNTSDSPTWGIARNYILSLFFSLKM